MKRTKLRIGANITFEYGMTGGPLDGCRYEGVISSKHMNEYMRLVNKKESHMIKEKDIILRGLLQKENL